MSALVIPTGFTRGPWAVNPFRAWVDSPKLDEDGIPTPIAALAWPTQYRTEAETAANARLIALAPAMAERIAVLEAERDELRAALQSIAAYGDKTASALLEQTGSFGFFDEPASVEMARAALAKSTPDPITTRFEIEATRPEDDL